MAGFRLNEYMSEQRSSIGFLLMGLKSEWLPELKNAMRASKYVFGLHPVNNDIIIGEITRLTEHENKSIRLEASNILKRLKFNYRGRTYRNFRGNGDDEGTLGNF